MHTSLEGRVPLVQIEGFKQEKESFEKLASYRKIACKTTSFVTSLCCFPVYIAKACYDYCTNNQNIAKVLVEIKYENSKGELVKERITKSNVQSFIGTKNMPATTGYWDLFKRVVLDFWGCCPYGDNSEKQLHYLFPEERTSYQKITGEKLQEIQLTNAEEIIVYYTPNSRRPPSFCLDDDDD